MSDLAFRALMNLVMCSDPWPISHEEKTIIQSELDREAVKRGFSDWIEAYHRYVSNAGSMIALNA